MKTIAYIDICDGNRTLKIYTPRERQNDRDVLPIFRLKKLNRILNAFESIENTGNIAVYLIKGKKTRFLFSKSI